MRIVWGVVALIGVAGCETLPEERPVSRPPQAIPALHGSYHQVRRGETLWRIAHSYGLDVRRLAEANRLPSPTQVAAGQRLFIPLPPESRQFLWPVRGALKGASPSHGVDIAASTGTLVRASRRGRVAVATRRLSGWGPTVVLDHLDGYFTVYAGLERLLVAPGTELRQGAPIGSVGSRALHFEIRYGGTPKNTLALLPRE